MAREFTLNRNVKHDTIEDDGRLASDPDAIFELSKRLASSRTLPVSH